MREESRTHSDNFFRSLSLSLSLSLSRSLSSPFPFSFSLPVALVPLNAFLILKAASTGRGVDRHLLALRMPLDFLAAEQSDDPMPLPPPPAQVALWDDALFKRAQTWELSTSNNSYLDQAGGHFGTVDPNGFGVGYLTRKEWTLFATECKKSVFPTGTAARFCDACVAALADIHELLGVAAADAAAVGGGEKTGGATDKARL